MKGRGNSSALTVKECVRLNIDNLKKTKFIVKGSQLEWVSKWTSGASIKAQSIFNEKAKQITLFYSYKDKPIQTVIQIAEVKSNLGKGVNLYFVCPVSSKLCKTIFCCYGSEIFKCRQAYSKRIYYPGQICSKVYRTVTQSNETGKRLNALRNLRKTNLYKGKKTKRKERIIKLQEKWVQLEQQKDKEIEEYLYKYLGLHRYNP